MEVVTDTKETEILAQQLGFDLVGFAEIEQLDVETARLSEWLNRGYHGSMLYMEKNREKRFDPTTILPSAKSVISLGLNYWQPGEYSSGTGKVSRYAWGRDYHLVIWEKLKIFEDELKVLYPGCETKSYVDTGAVMDKAWALRAGLGWMGKHTNIINREWGSWFFIANIFTDLKFPPSIVVEDHCGSCTACIDACPTDAIAQEYVVDGSRCISFLTIENKGEIAGEFEGKMDDWIFGCDICQDVCPWNKKFKQETDSPDFKRGIKMSEDNTLPSLNKEFDPDFFDKIENDQFKKIFAESPVLRSKLKGMRRNSEFIKRKKK
ncbi:tRNA epoxyqueuosine(34) reductase QueG [Ignavibacteriales bacterium]